MSKTHTNAQYRPDSAQLSGCGIGLRHQHMQEIAQHCPDVPWFEIISDNFIAANGQTIGGLDHRLLMRIREDYPISMHGVGMSLGSVDPLDWNYIQAIKTLADDIECQWVSEHATFVSVDNNHFHDLLPLPYTEEALNHLSERISQVQDFLQQPLSIENTTHYIRCEYDAMSDAEFLTELTKRCGCNLLVDINNLYINQYNHGWKALDFLQTVPNEKVREIHLAGFSQSDELLIDSHSAAVSEEVWTLYQQALVKFGPTATLIEWDNNIPNFSELQQQAKRAQGYLNTTRHQTLKLL